MKLLRYRDGNSIKPGILDNDGMIKDVSSLVNDWNGKTLNQETINKVNDCNISNLPSINSVCASV